MKIASDLDDFHQIILKTLDFSNDSGEDQCDSSTKHSGNNFRDEIMHIHFMVVKKSVKKESKQAGDHKTSNVSHKTQNPANSSSNKL